MARTFSHETSYRYHYSTQLTCEAATSTCLFLIAFKNSNNFSLHSIVPSQNLSSHLSALPSHLATKLTYGGFKITPLTSCVIPINLLVRLNNEDTESILV